MNNNYQNEQRDEQVAGTPDDAVDARIDSALKDLHTTTIGIIVSFDPVKQTCSVQPAIQRVWTDKGPVNLPLCVDCPVFFPSGGGFMLTFPIAEGDECIISFTERCLDNWYENGQLAAPAEYRMHDLSDGVVHVGLNNQTKSIENFRMDGVDLRSRDGHTRVTLRESGTIESVNQNGNVVLANTGQISLVNTAASFIVGTDGSVRVAAPGGFFVTAPHQTNTGDITATGDVHGQGKSLHDHTHNVQHVAGGLLTLPSDPPT